MPLASDVAGVEAGALAGVVVPLVVGAVFVEEFIVSRDGWYGCGYMN